MVGLLVAGALAAAEPNAMLGKENGHGDPIAPVILGVTGILFFATLGRFMARHFGQPSVLGELSMGVLIGNVGHYLSIDLVEILREGTVIFDMVDQVLIGTPLAEAAFNTLSPTVAPAILEILSGPRGGELMQVAHTVDVFSRYGVIFLLFLVGLQTNVQEMRAVGVESFRVALVGLFLPFVLGFVLLWGLMPSLSLDQDVFVAAALAATSIGISARVIQELKLTNGREARVILGAAVIDDILGLVLLVIVSGIIVSGGMELVNAASIIVLSGLFLVSIFTVGPAFLKTAIRLVRRLDVVEAKMFISFLFVMALAWLANFIGLATIVGAFAAGVVLHDNYFDHWAKSRLSIHDLVAPLEAILVPIFFVLMGMQVKLESMLDPAVLLVSAGLIVAAVVGKIACGLVTDRGTNRLAVGFGMMPRGEVGLIFASIGKSLGVINDELFSAVVLMVMVTTMASPPLLKWSLSRQQQKK